MACVCVCVIMRAFADPPVWSCCWFWSRPRGRISELVQPCVSVSERFQVGRPARTRCDRAGTAPGAGWRSLADWTPPLDSSAPCEGGRAPKRRGNNLASLQTPVTPQGCLWKYRRGDESTSRLTPTHFGLTQVCKIRHWRDVRSLCKPAVTIKLNIMPREGICSGRSLSRGKTVLLVRFTPNAVSLETALTKENGPLPSSVAKGDNTKNKRGERRGGGKIRRQ